MKRSLLPLTVSGVIGAVIEAERLQSVTNYLFGELNDWQLIARRRSGKTILTNSIVEVRTILCWLMTRFDPGPYRPLGVVVGWIETEEGLKLIRERASPDIAVRVGPVVPEYIRLINDVTFRGYYQRYHFYNNAVMDLPDHWSFYSPRSPGKSKLHPQLLNRFSRLSR